MFRRGEGALARWRGELSGAEMCTGRGAGALGEGLGEQRPCSSKVSLALRALAAAGHSCPALRCLLLTLSHKLQSPSRCWRSGSRPGRAACRLGTEAPGPGPGARSSTAGLGSSSRSPSRPLPQGQCSALQRCVGHNTGGGSHTGLLFTAAAAAALAALALALARSCRRRRCRRRQRSTLPAPNPGNSRAQHGPARPTPALQAQAGLLGKRCRGPRLPRHPQWLPALASGGCQRRRPRQGRLAGLQLQLPAGGAAAPGTAGSASQRRCRAR